MDTSGTQEGVPMGEVLTDPSIAVASSSTSAAPVPGVRVRPWTPSGVEEVWIDFIKEVKPDLEVAISKAVCGAMKVMEFSSVRMFQALTRVQLRDSRESWVGVTDDVWEVISSLEVAWSQHRSRW